MAGGASFWTQTDALLRKNLIYQKRNMKANIRLILFPIVLCVLLAMMQRFIDKNLGKEQGNIKCDKTPSGEGEKQLAAFCAVRKPPENFPLLQVPYPIFRAMESNAAPFADLAPKSCLKISTCPVTMLYTAANFNNFSQFFIGNMFTSSFAMEPDVNPFALNAVGSELPMETESMDPALMLTPSLYYIQNQCGKDSTIEMPPGSGQEVSCVQGLRLWRNTSSDINNEIYKGYTAGNPQKEINEYAGAFDLSDSNLNRFNVTIWYNSTGNPDEHGAYKPKRVPRSVNLISNAYLRSVLGRNARILYEFEKGMPKHEIPIKIEAATLIGALFYIWIILQLFPVALTALVYEKEQKLRIMMKMHGLGEGPYWLISYAYFLTISVVYMFGFVTFGSLLGLRFFTLNDYKLQFLFYFIYVNLQVAVAFLASTMFTTARTATVTAYIVVFGSGLLGGFLFEKLLASPLFPKVWVSALELYFGFALYRGLYEFSTSTMKGEGLRWEDIHDSSNGMKELLIIMFVEWIVVLFVAYYIDQGRGKSSRKADKRKSATSRNVVHLDKPDVIQEREKVEQLVLDSSNTKGMLSDELSKVYPPRDGNPEKIAVRGLSIAVPPGECLGMLGPNGAGKTSFISMMIGLTKPSDGTAYIEGLDIRSQMDEVYTQMGVCPQYDLLWDTLTAREHLLFYGRLKNLSGSALTKAVEDSLKNLDIFYGVADKPSGSYSGGMKRRLSVAISLIGDPKVVYLDEPSTGLDPASRNSLWKVVKRAKQDRAIILTTHSMEEADALCDRLGVFVSGALRCIGNLPELKNRYGGTYVLTMTTASEYEKEVENLAHQLTPNANKIYHISGTQKFELSKEEVKIADVFKAVENAKSQFTITAWGLADTTLEDVFIKVAREAEENIALS